MLHFCVRPVFNNKKSYIFGKFKTGPFINKITSAQKTCISKAVSERNNFKDLNLKDKKKKN